VKDNSLDGDRAFESPRRKGNTLKRKGKNITNDILEKVKLRMLVAVIVIATTTIL